MDALFPQRGPISSIYIHRALNILSTDTILEFFVVFPWTGRQLPFLHCSHFISRDLSIRTLLIKIAILNSRDIEVQYRVSILIFSANFRYLLFCSIKIPRRTIQETQVEISATPRETYVE